MVLNHDQITIFLQFPNRGDHCGVVLRVEPTITCLRWISELNSSAHLWKTFFPVFSTSNMINQEVMFPYTWQSKLLYLHAQSLPIMNSVICYLLGNQSLNISPAQFLIFETKQIFSFKNMTTLWMTTCTPLTIRWSWLRSYYDGWEVLRWDQYNPTCLTFTNVFRHSPNPSSISIFTTKDRCWQGDVGEDSTQ